MAVQSTHAFSEKIALVTGGENAFGRAVAMQLAILGCYVIVGYSGKDEQNERALSELKNIGTLANSFQSDISTAKGAGKLVNEVENLYGRLDLLVNCVRFVPEFAFEETSEVQFDEAINKNVKSVFFVTQSAINLMKERPKPKIVNLVSACDTAETGQNILFAASNNAITGFTKSLSKTLPKNFRINAVATSEKQKQTENLDAELFRAKTGISEDDVARVIVYLLSSEAITLNGQILTVE